MFTVIPCLQHIDIAVLTQDREGFSNAIMEYMICGLPIVATNVGGTPELIHSGNAVVFGKALLDLLTKPDKHLALG